MKTKFAFVFVVLAMILAACGGAAAEEPPAPAEPTALAEPTAFPPTALAEPTAFPPTATPIPVGASRIMAGNDAIVLCEDGRIFAVYLEQFGSHTKARSLDFSMHPVLSTCNFTHLGVYHEGEFKYFSASGPYLNDGDVIDVSQVNELFFTWDKTNITGLVLSTELGSSLDNVTVRSSANATETWGNSIPDSIMKAEASLTGDGHGCATFYPPDMVIHVTEIRTSELSCSE